MDGVAPPTAERSPACQHRLKIVIVSEEDPLYVIEFFKVFFAEYPRDEFELAGITIDRPFHEPLARTFRRLLQMYGARDTLRQGLRFASARARGTSIAALAQAGGIPLMPAVSVNDPDYIARVRTAAPDVIVSVACPEIFRPALLSLPRLGCINVHSGRLPAYRGMMPTFWQMLNGESAITVTVHTMAEQLDAGAVLATAEAPIRPRDSLDRVIRVTKQAGARLTIRVLRDLRASLVQPVPVNMSDAGYFTFPSSADVRAFRALGHRLL